jgi:glycosyltransferase involved in cell wall biosynthesis
VNPALASIPRAGIPLVSIIVPLYNHAKYIEATLESFANEGHPNLEVVIIDDGSKDNSFDVAQAWFARHPNAFTNVVLERQENAGITKTLNRLVARCTGEFITMVASDDLLLPGGIQVRLDALERRPDWLSVFGDAAMIDEQGVQTASSALHKINRTNLKALEYDHLRTQELILRWSIPGPVLLSRRKAFDPERGVGPYDETMFIEDRDLYLRLLARNALGFVSQAVAAYRMHTRNTIAAPAVKARVYKSMFEAESKHRQQFNGATRWALELMRVHSQQNLKRVESHSLTWLMSILSLISLEIARNTWCLAQDLNVLMAKD